MESRDFDSPDETRTPAKTQVDLCVWARRQRRDSRVGVVHSGRLVLAHEDGTEVQTGPGEAYVIEPGHDAWVLGDERFVGVESESRSAEEHAKG